MKSRQRGHASLHTRTHTRLHMLAITVAVVLSCTCLARAFPAANQPINAIPYYENDPTNPANATVPVSTQNQSIQAATNANVAGQTGNAAESDTSSDSESKTPENDDSEDGEVVEGNSGQVLDEVKEQTVNFDDSFAEDDPTDTGAGIPTATLGIQKPKRPKFVGKEYEILTCPPEAMSMLQKCAVIMDGVCYDTLEAAILASAPGFNDTNTNTTNSAATSIGFALPNQTAANATQPITNRSVTLTNTDTTKTNTTTKDSDWVSWDDQDQWDDNTTTNGTYGINGTNSTIEEVFAWWPGNRTIYVGRLQAIDKPIQFAHNLTIIGCAGSNGTIRLNIAMPEWLGLGRGAFELIGSAQRFAMAQFDAEMTEGKAASFIRVPTAQPISDVDLVLQRVHVSNFQNEVEGTAIFLKNVTRMILDEDTSFVNNINRDTGEGGGTVYALLMYPWSYAKIAATFEGNIIKSWHGEGGGLFVMEMDGIMDVPGVFKGNKAVGGSAVYFKHSGTRSVTTLSGVFTENISMRGTCGIRKMKGTVEMSGTFMDNLSMLGCCFRSNHINGNVTLNGYYKNNQVKYHELQDFTFKQPRDWPKLYKGAVLYAYSLSGNITMSGTFEDNYSQDYGGVLALFDGLNVSASIDMTQGSFKNNQARYGLVYHIDDSCGGRRPVGGDVGGILLQNKDAPLNCLYQDTD